MCVGALITRYHHIPEARCFHCRWEILLVYSRSLAVGPLPARLMTGEDTAGNDFFLKGVSRGKNSASDYKENR